ncbi:MAG: YdcF family protein [Myxococcales bacterium]|nr:YdcF family protein [Myxococcales bacterium]MCB9629139.1 YdcF family protein [Sandaracinaceae bacterium]
MAPLLADQRFALVSEASHLLRAMRFFEAEGVHPVAAPAMWLSRADSDWRVEAGAELESERAFHEGLGQLWQRARE